MPKVIENISLSVFDQDGDGLADAVSVSYRLSDDADTTFRSRGSFIMSNPDFNDSISSVLAAARQEIGVREGIVFPSSSSSSSSSSGP